MVLSLPIMGNFYEISLLMHPLFYEKTLDGKINHILTKVKHIFGIIPYLKKIYKTVDPLLSSKPKEMHGSWFVYGIFYFEKTTTHCTF